MVSDLCRNTMEVDSVLVVIFVLCLEREESKRVMLMVVFGRRE